MKSILLASAAYLGLAAGASAQSLDWSGFYGGVMAGKTTEEEDLYDGGVLSSTYDYDGGYTGLFAGFNAQNGQVVYGGELAYSPGDVDDPASHSIVHSKYLDLKGRVGYATDPVLFYGVLGYSWANMVESPGNVDETIKGLNYGLGVEYQLNNRVFIGAEYLRRNLDVDYTSSGFPTFTGDVASKSFSLRLGMIF